MTRRKKKGKESKHEQGMYIRYAVRIGISCVTMTKLRTSLVHFRAEGVCLFVLGLVVAVDAVAVADHAPDKCLILRSAGIVELRGAVYLTLPL